MEPNMEQPKIEQDIENLAKAIQEKGLSEKGREALKSVLLEKTSAPQPVAQAPVVPVTPKKDTGNLPNYMAAEPAELKQKVEVLIASAWKHGIKAAAKEASAAGPMMLDAFHDALTDKLYSELKKRGLLK